MPPTIRIDEEVYDWLQQNARPFEDTPNSVLRRIAKLDDSSHPPKTDNALSHKKLVGGQATNKLLKAACLHGRGRMGLDGKQLNVEWNVGARHALFSRDGKWYQNLERFPGALFDPNGYLLFKTKEEFLKNTHIRVGIKTNIPGGIASIPGYVRKT